MSNWYMVSCALYKSMHLQFRQEAISTPLNYSNYAQFGARCRVISCACYISLLQVVQVNIAGATACVLSADFCVQSYVLSHSSTNLCLVFILYFFQLEFLEVISWRKRYHKLWAQTHIWFQRCNKECIIPHLQ